MHAEDHMVPVLQQHAVPRKGGKETACRSSAGTGGGLLGGGTCAPVFTAAGVRATSLRRPARSRGGGGHGRNQLVSTGFSPASEKWHLKGGGGLLLLLFCK